MPAAPLRLRRATVSSRASLMLAALPMVAAGLAFTPALSVAAPRASPPNFVFILADDLGWADTAVLMDPARPDSRSADVDTPRLAAFARQSTRFAAAYAPAPICTPSRRSIQYGMTPARQRGTEFFSDFHPDGHLSIPLALKSIDSRYRCAHLGKWGEVMVGRSYAEKLPAAAPEVWGYDQSDGVTGNRTGVFYHERIDGAGAYLRNWIAQEADDPKLTFSVTARAIDFLRGRAGSDAPFFLQVSYYAIHTAHVARPETLAKYRARHPGGSRQSIGVAAMTEDLDTAVGQLLDQLDQLDLTRNTYVVFTSDNGGEQDPPRADAPSAPPRNFPLRLGKQWIYDGGVRVPLLVRGPGVAPDRVSRVPVALYDLLPTFYELAGGQAPLPAEIDGGSLAKLLRSRVDAPVSRAAPGIVLHRPKFETPLSALRVGDLKLVLDWTTGHADLFDLSTDPGELRDLSAEQPEITAELGAHLRAYLDSIHAEQPDTAQRCPPPARFPPSPPRSRSARPPNPPTAPAPSASRSPRFAPGRPCATACSSTSA